MTEPTRIRRSRTKGWRKPEGAVIVDRTSRFGNPFAVGRDATDNAHAVTLFKAWLERDDPDTLDPYGSAEYRQAMSNRREWILDNLHRLAGRDLVCFCGPDADCHADVLLRAAAELYGGAK